MAAKRWGKRILIATAVAAIVGLLVLAPGLLRVYLWMQSVSWPSVEATVQVDGKTVPADVHRSPDGRYARIDCGLRLYVVDFREKRLGSPSRSAHKIFLGRYLPEEGFFGVEVSADNAKSEHDPRLVVRNGQVEFVDYDDKRVVVTIVGS